MAIRDFHNPVQLIVFAGSDIFCRSDLVANCQLHCSGLKHLKTFCRFQREQQLTRTPSAVRPGSGSEIQPE